MKENFTMLETFNEVINAFEIQCEYKAEDICNNMPVKEMLETVRKKLSYNGTENKQMTDLFGNSTKRKRKNPVIPEGSKPFYPSNATEGDIFHANICRFCTKSSSCKIWANAMHGNHPKQWVRLADGGATCLSMREKK